MAQDRLYLKCAWCGDIRRFASICGTVPDTLDALFGSVTPTEGFGEWVIKHLRHHPNTVLYDVGLQRFMNPSEWFVIESESTPTHTSQTSEYQVRVADMEPPPAGSVSVMQHCNDVETAIKAAKGWASTMDGKGEPMFRVSVVHVLETKTEEEIPFHA